MNYEENNFSGFNAHFQDEKPKVENEEIFYFVDFSKLANVNDLLSVLASMGFGISNKNPYYEQIKQFLDNDRPVKLK